MILISKIKKYRNYTIIFQNQNRNKKFEIVIIRVSDNSYRSLYRHCDSKYSAKALLLFNYYINRTQSKSVNKNTVNINKAEHHINNS